MTDAEFVQQSGFIKSLVQGGFSGKGMQVMGDRGFNFIAVTLMGAGIHSLVCSTSGQTKQGGPIHSVRRSNY